MPHLLIACFTILVLAASPASARDNFIVFIADDLGVDGIGKYSDDLAYGHPGEGAAPVVTPNIDTLAEQGILFRNAYTNALCAPTRAQLLTGRHALRTGIGKPGGAVLDLAEQTLPELLSATHLNAAIGKWHVGPGSDADHPIESGFDYFAGAVAGNINDYYSWKKTINDTSLVETETDPHVVYATDDASAEAIAKIKEFGDDEFFLWVAFNAPHGPFHVPTAPLTTSVNAGSNNRTKYVAAVEAMDREIQDILDAMTPAVRADTTIIFIGDNGTPSGVTEAPFVSNHAKGTMYEGGINVPLIVVSPHIDLADQGKESMALVQSVDVFATIAEIAGLQSPAEDSISILPYLDDPDLPTGALRPYAYAESFDPNGLGVIYTDHERAFTD
jgi:arylsulfatase A-like enzyme